MSGWQVPANATSDGSVTVPAGTRPATMGYRIGAWFLDSILVGLLGIIPFIGAIVTGAVSLNQRALDQVDTYSNFPFDGVTAPLIKANLSLLVFWAAVYVAINAAYFVVSWVGSGATPFQRLLKIRVVDRWSSRNLTVSQASLRWFVLYGIGLIVSLIPLVFIVDWVTKTPTNQWLGSSYRYSGGLSSGLGAEYTLLSWGSTIWAIALLIAAATNSTRRGIHDRLAGSVVLSPLQTPAPWPGYPPQAGPYWPGYPPQAGPYWPPPGAYPPQPVYLPQAGSESSPPATMPPETPPAESPEDA